MAYTFKHGDRPLDDFTIQRAVGRGGFGEVYYAVSDGGREVALKYLRENPQVELRGTAHCINLKSPHLVTIFDVKKSAEGDYFIIMEYVSGPSLRDLLIAQPDGLGPQKAAFFVREIAKGLAYLHDRGIVHRDLKPGNIFYEEGYVKIGDYGLSKFISVSRHSAQTASVGTVHYMAPEVGTGNYHRGIDLYALGVMLYEMLLGRVPFEGGSMGEVLMKHLTAQAEVDHLPAPYGRVIRKALQKDPAERYQTVYEMVDDLLEVDDVRTSLAGFNPASLSAAVARKRGSGTPSPVPSPNPLPRVVPPVGRGVHPIPDLDAGHLPPRMQKRLARTSKKVDQRLRKLEGRHGSRPRWRPAHADGSTQPPPHPNPIETRGELVQRMVLSVLMALALGVGVGFVADGDGRLMVGSITMILGMTLGLVLGCRLVSAVSAGRTQPKWVVHACMLVATAIPLFVGAAPIIAYNERAGGLTCLALLVTIVLADWRKRIITGTDGQLSIGKAFWAGAVGMFFTAAFTHGDDRFIPIGAGVAASVSLMMQALSWFFPLRQWLDGVPAALVTPVGMPLVTGGASAADTGRDDAGGGGRVDAAGMETLSYHPSGDRAGAMDAMAAGAGGGPVGKRGGMGAFVQEPQVKPRFMLTRVLGGLSGMALLTVIIGGLVLLPGLGDGSPGSPERVAVVRNVVSVSVGLVAAIGLMLFAFHKSRRYRTGGFYRDTLRPLLLIVPFLGFTVVAAVRVLENRGIVHVNSDGDLLHRSAVVLSAIMLVVLLCKRGKRYPRYRLESPAKAADATDTDNSPSPAGAS